jgi:hypothetical protein
MRLGELGCPESCILEDDFLGDNDKGFGVFDVARSTLALNCRMASLVGAIFFGDEALSALALICIKLALLDLIASLDSDFVLIGPFRQSPLDDGTAVPNGLVVLW